MRSDQLILLIGAIITADTVPDNQKVWAFLAFMVAVYCCEFAAALREKRSA